ncbi:MAG: hypothetical protein ACK55Z_01750, partial [bacterium]
LGGTKFRTLKRVRLCDAQFFARCSRFFARSSILSPQFAIFARSSRGPVCPHLRKQDVRCFIENQNNLQTRHYCPPAPSSSLDDVFRQLLMYGRDNFSDNLLQVRRRSLSASKHSACIIVF